jgi:hypothetical protein
MGKNNWGIKDITFPEGVEISFLGGEYAIPFKMRRFNL